MKLEHNHTVYFYRRKNIWYIFIILQQGLFYRFDLNIKVNSQQSLTLKFTQNV
jgi:hypothetical protein